MRLPDNVYNTLVQLCKAYPWDVVQNTYHIGEILNAVAYAHRNDGWGVSRKNGGKRIDSPVGSIAEDILQLPDGNHFDVLSGIDKGQPLRPSQASSIGIINLRDRPWVAPKDHPIEWLGAEPYEPPVTPTEPTPVKPIECKFAQCDCGVKIDLLSARVEALASHFNQIGADLIQGVGELNSRPQVKCKVPW